ncbi:tRNA-modifying protein YgfZ [Colwellia hornerae]|uniref:tRNA-modifying protein YgfZ n=1 Tax=Colwellia hornerae TaxID=89402 RepID=A0A5C6QTM1_9GAMM|nr:tRNA-modifying protein YgfZ [Colwellia hornerae]TWX56911.1 tRNA-modifying protein YgfZ [Colwellia hornerae]TWX62364.1 tRNA-modifying protein YgfZ [Colwellia hornerae]TWX72304.1 tRNA-modifying protein YgfZ [Colwellia hornerae]
MTISVENTLPNYDNLPDACIISLAEYGAIAVHGTEQSKYLQGQVTCDVNTLTDNNLLLGGHCDAKGKVFSVFRLINRQNIHLLLQPITSINQSLAELKKFGVFAKVTIEQTTDLAFYAVAGKKATAVLHQKFVELPNSLTPVLQVGSTTIVYLAGKLTRYLIIDEAKAAEQMINDFALVTYSQALWNLIEINEGFPLLAPETVTTYVPQMLNLQAIHGISFTKGCYLGQETVARMQYLGKNKRALFSLKSKSANNELITLQAGDIIEQQLGENWRKAGDILASYISDDGIYYLQAVLASDIDSTTNLRIKNHENSALSLVELPYNLAE